MTNTTAPATVEAMHDARIRYAGVEGHVQSTYTRSGVVDEIVIRLDNGRVIGDLAPSDVEWLPAPSTATAFTVTDQYTAHRADRIAGADVARTIRPWFPEAPGHIRDAIDELGEVCATDGRDVQVAAARLAEYLGLTVERHGD